MQVSVYTRSSNEYLKYAGKKKSNCFVNIKKYIKLFFICACVDLKEMGFWKSCIVKWQRKVRSPPPPEYTKTSTCLYSIVRLVDTFIFSIVLTKVNKIRTKFVRKKTDGVQKLDNRCYTMIGKRHNTNCDLDPI